MPGPMRKNNYQTAEKGSFAKNMGKLFRYFKKYWGWLAFSLVLGVVGVVAQIILPDKLKEVTAIISRGIVSGTTDLGAITEVCVFMLILIVLGAIFTYFQQYISTVTTLKMVKRFRTNISRKINKLPLNFFDTHLHGDVLSVVTNDVDTIGQSLNEGLGTMFSSTLLLLGVVVMMFVTDWILAFTVIGTAIVGFLFSLIFLTKSQKYFNQNQQNMGELNAHIEESYSGHNVVRLYNAEKSQEQEFNKINRKLYSSGWKSQFISGVMGPVMGFVGNLSYVMVCIIGAVIASKRGVEYIAVIVAFMLYARFFSRPLTSIAQALTSLQSASAASGRVFKLLEETELDDEGDKTAVIPAVKGDVLFKNVEFGYNSDRTIIKDFSLDVKAGQKIAIVGPTGAGKTTLVNLLMRFYETNAGDILIDGVSIKDMKRETLHELFGMVLQDTWLFQGTILENLKYNKKDVPDKKVFEVCKAVGVDHFIQTLPNGYNTIIDDSINLSAGQKQLLTIARTMIEDRPMIILDEATSSVDTRTEVLLQKAMDKIMEGRTSFVIAHRLSTIKNADTILVLKDGDIIEKGKHKALLAAGGAYAELYNSQFEEE